MVINQVRQINKEDLLQSKFDIVIMASGYESRASYLASILNINTDCKKIVLSFQNYKETQERTKNDELYSKLNYEPVECKENESNLIIDILNEFIIKSSIEKLSILIDYSSMTRVWYSAIINFLNEYETKKTLNVYYVYSSAKFYPPSSDESKILNFSPIDGFCNLSIPSNPTALITALGYEKNKAYGLREYFDAQEMYLFLTVDNKFTTIVQERNNDLILSIPESNCIQYNLNDLLYTKSILYDLCLKLKDDYRIIIAPCGPKPFTLLSFLVASSLKMIDIWRISGIDQHSERKASGNLLSLEVTYNVE
ncbi:MAG: hypothetical protein C0397_09840 [Odoribacter sp.]|nr:hypothetical protein [Odoribacter sp.]